MNKKEKQEIGQSLIDLIYEVDGHIDTFLEEFIDWKYVKENIDIDKLTKEYAPAIPAPPVAPPPVLPAFTWLVPLK